MRSRVSAFVAAAGGRGSVVVVVAGSGFVGVGLFGEGVDLMEDLDPGPGSLMLSMRSWSSGRGWLCHVCLGIAISSNLLDDR